MGSARVGSLAVVVVVAVAAGGCLKPWLKRLGTVPEARPAPALVGGMVARFDGPASPIDLAGGNGLEDFGRGVVDPLQRAVAAHGYALVFDKARALGLGVPEAGAADALALSGQWHHPETSAWTPDLVESPSCAPRELVQQLGSAEPGPAYFAFVGVDINDVGNVFREPIVIARVTVYDDDATKVLDLRGIGTGSSSFLFADRSPTNLRTAFDEAVASLATVVEEPL